MTRNENLAAEAEWCQLCIELRTHQLALAKVEKKIKEIEKKLGKGIDK